MHNATQWTYRLRPRHEMDYLVGKELDNGIIDCFIQAMYTGG